MMTTAYQIKILLPKISINLIFATKFRAKGKYEVGNTDRLVVYCTIAEATLGIPSSHHVHEYSHCDPSVDFLLTNSVTFRHESKYK